MREARTKIRILLYGIIGIICILITFRLALELLGARGDTGLVQILQNITDFFILPFRTSAATSIFASGILAILFFIILGVLIVEVVTGLIYDSVYEIIQNLVDGIFKIVEVLLFLRIILELFNIRPQDGVLSLIYNFTDWSAGVFNNPSFIPNNVSLSVIFVLVVVVILDIFVGNVLESLFKFAKESPKLNNPPVVRQEKVTERVVERNQPVNIQVHHYSNVQPRQPVIAMPVNSTISNPQPKTIGMTPVQRIKNFFKR